MSLRILVPVDGSPQSDAALEYVLEHHPDADVTVLHVIDPLELGYSADPTGDAFWEGWWEFARERGESLLAGAESIATDHGATVATESEIGPPARTIVEFAEDHDVDHVVMGSHGREGLSRVLLGSVAERVVRRSPVPVTVVR